MSTELDNMDIEAISSEIGSELFGGDVDSPPDLGSNENVGEQTQSASEASPPIQKGTSEASQGEAKPGEAGSAVGSAVSSMPGTWKKEMEADWKALPQSVRDYVKTRESQAMQGIQQYSQGYKSWDAVTRPFAEIFSAHPDVQPIGLLQNLMQSHIKLLTLPDAEKQVFANEIFKAYGINQAPQSLDQATAQQMQRLEALERAEAHRAQQSRIEAQNRFTADVAKARAEIDAFSSDPKNPHFLEVANDIHRLISSGVCTDVKSAYEMAVWNNPSVRQKLLAEQQETARLNALSKPKVRNINGSSTAAIRPGKPMSIDDTIDSVIAKYTNTH
jgi:hypothetical protein